MLLGIMVIVASVAVARPAHADPDTDFAFTLGSFIVSDLVIIQQIGTTICLGLIFDTSIVRSLMTPSIAALLGRWFWWPLNVRTRPASQMLQPFGSRISVRKLLGPDPRPSTSGTDGA
jgi:RND superfamily putative drug exporter